MRLWKKYSIVLLGPWMVLAPAIATPNAAAPVRPASLAGELPADFIENRGQWDESVEFVARKGALAVAFEKNAISMRVAARQAESLRLTFEGSTTKPTVTGEARRTSHYNFFFGNDSKKWRERVPIYGSVLYQGLYEGVDVRVRAEADRLEYDLSLAPKADLRQVIISCQGTKSLERSEER